MAVIKCAECQCAPQNCTTNAIAEQCCIICQKEVCFCIAIHRHTSLINKSLALSDEPSLANKDYCCSTDACKDEMIERQTGSPHLLSSGWLQFFRHAKSLYATALGIEILCIAAAEIGENLGLHLFGFNLVGIPIAYAMGYALAGFTTFATILGRYDHGRIDSCCSVLEQGTGITSNLKMTFRNFAVGTTRITRLHKQRNLKHILKTSGYILVTAESACILTAEAVDLIFYQYSILLAVPLALLAGAFTVVVPEAYRKMNAAKSNQ